MTLVFVTIGSIFATASAFALARRMISEGSSPSLATPLAEARDWRDEIDSLREAMLQMRVEVSEARRSDAVREAEVQRLRVLMSELARATDMREENVRQALGARLRLVDERVSAELASRQHTAS